MIDLCIEANQRGVPITTKAPTVYCRAFEDNTGAYEMATTPKMRLRTRHINVKYHHFRHHVRNSSKFRESIRRNRLLIYSPNNVPSDSLRNLELVLWVGNPARETRECDNVLISDTHHSLYDTQFPYIFPCTNTNRDSITPD